MTFVIGFEIQWCGGGSRWHIVEGWQSLIDLKTIPRPDLHRQLILKLHDIPSMLEYCGIQQQKKLKVRSRVVDMQSTNMLEGTKHDAANGMSLHSAQPGGASYCIILLCRPESTLRRLSQCGSPRDRLRVLRELPRRQQILDVFKHVRKEYCQHVIRPEFEVRVSNYTHRKSLMLT